MVHFLIDDPDSTIQIVNESLFKISPLDGAFNDLMELKNFLTKYYSTDDEDKVAFSHFLKAEHYLRQKKIGDAIRELVYINTELGSSKIIPLTNLRLSLLHYRIKDYDNALQFAFSALTQQSSKELPDTHWLSPNGVNSPSVPQQ